LNSVADCYPRDLLVSVLHAESAFWRQHPQLRERAAAVAQRAIWVFPDVPEIASKTVTRAVNRANAEFAREV
jgi:hypothetical protein